jgi:hypothetical protein
MKPGIFSALYHFVRLRYYMAALEHVGHFHRDSHYLTMCCVESQIVVDEFLNTRSAREGQ